LLDTYIPEPAEREQAFSAVDNIPSIKRKADFMFKWINNINDLDKLDTADKKRQFMMNLICFASCVEGLFFFAAFAYVYFLRSKGLLNGLAGGTNWVFRDESMHIAAALEVIKTARAEDPTLFSPKMEADVVEMMKEALECEMAFAEDLLGLGVAGLSANGMRQYLQCVADQRLVALGIKPVYGSKNPFNFMELQDVQELANFFERRVSAYQVGVTGAVAFTDEF
jgi:ribonucleoside-diphosphate reductase beta chain